MSARWLALVMLVSALGAVGCRARVDDDRFACATGVCPEGFSCIAGRCRLGVDLDGGLGALDAPHEDVGGLDAAAPEGGVGDAASEDAPSDARALSDAARDGGPDAARDAARDAGPVHPVRVLGAVGDDGGTMLERVSVVLAGESREVGFGCVTRFASVPAGVQTLTFTVGREPVTTDILVEEPTLVVIGRSQTGALEAYTRTDDLPSPDGSDGAVAYLPLVRTAAGDVLLQQGLGGTRGGVDPGVWTSTYASATWTWRSATPSR